MSNRQVFFRTRSSSRNCLQLALVNIKEQQTDNLGYDFDTNEVNNNISWHET
jgi:hypothetical protein